jgi:hypothetical protein
MVDATGRLPPAPLAGAAAEDAQLFSSIFILLGTYECSGEGQVTAIFEMPLRLVCALVHTRVTKNFNRKGGIDPIRKEGYRSLSMPVQLPPNARLTFLI